MQVQQRKKGSNFNPGEMRRSLFLNYPERKENHRTKPSGLGCLKIGYHQKEDTDMDISCKKLDSHEERESLIMY